MKHANIRINVISEDQFWPKLLDLNIFCIKSLWLLLKETGQNCSKHNYSDNSSRGKVIVSIECVIKPLIYLCEKWF